MGGNAVKNFGNVIRLNTHEFDELALDIVRNSLSTVLLICKHCGSTL